MKRKQFYTLLSFIILSFSLFGQIKSVELSEDQKIKIDQFKVQMERLNMDSQKPQIADLCNKMAFLYWDNESTIEAIEFFRRSIDLNKEIGNQNAVQKINFNIALIYYETDLYSDAIAYFQLSKNINQELNRKDQVASDLYNIALCLKALQKYEESNTLLLEANEIFKEYSNVQGLKNGYSTLAENFEKLGNSAESMKYYDLYMSFARKITEDKINQAELKAQNIEKENVKKEVELQQQADTLKDVIQANVQQGFMIDSLNEMNNLRDLIIKEQQQRQKAFVFTGLSVGAFLIVLILSFIFVYRQLREKKASALLLEKKNLEIEMQKTEIEKQRDFAHESSKRITDSIRYARRIQKAILNPQENIQYYFKDSFIFFKPRDIVSGDFYWFTRKENIVIVVAADCTGHGVPGAFMSMLGVAFLNEIVNKIAVNRHVNSLQASEILNQLREQIIISLRQRAGKENSKDGMDMAICIFDYDNHTLQYSGAYNSLYLVRNKVMEVYEADRMPVSVHRRANDEFTNHFIHLQDNDRFYIFSDGFMDQFGGKEGKKYLSKNFKNILLKNHQLPFQKQKEILENELKEWMGDENEQLDDIVIIGTLYSSKFRLKTKKEDRDWANKRILIAEDIDVNYFLLVEVLNETNAQVFRAINGQEAVEICKSNIFDLILMDINMPVMNGYEATKEIRTFRKDIPIIAQTAQYNEGDKSELMKAGFNDFIAKPIDLKTFIAIIEKFLYR